MQNQTNLGKLKATIFIGRALKGSILALAIFILGFILVPALIAEASASQYADASVRWGAVSLTFDPDYGNGNIGDVGHGDIDFGELVPTANNLAEAGSSYGTLKVLKKTISITSSGKFYTVYISTLTDNNDLTLELSGGGNNSSITIPATASTFASPAGFTDSGWGFAVPGVQNTGIDSAPSTFVIPELLDTQIGVQTALAGAAQTYGSTKWAAVPGSDAPQQIWKAEAEGAAGENYGFGTYTNDQNVEVTGDTTNNHFDIYYAVAVDTDILAGTYSNRIVYTALASAASLDSVSNNIAHDRSFGGATDTQTIRFDLTQSTVGFDESDITITLVPHHVMVDNNYENSLAFDIADLGSATTPGYLNCPVVQNSLVINGYVEVECITPVAALADNAGSGAYDFWVHIDGYNYNYVSKDSVTKNNVTSTVPSFYYVGLQTEYPHGTGVDEYLDPRYDSTAGADNRIVKEMQQMSAGVCSNTNIWGNQTGNDARIYDPTGLESLVADIMTTEEQVDSEDPEQTIEVEVVDGPATLAANSALNIGTFQLTDGRDQKPYLVRRLADGNCWMVQNLLFTETDLDPTTTDIDQTKTLSYGDITLGSSDSEPRIAEGVDSNGGPTVWYNYPAATAMTVTASNATAQAEHSLCSKNWKLPTLTNISNITNYLSTFSPVTAGFYDISGNLRNLTTGYWKTSSGGNNQQGRSYLRYLGHAETMNASASGDLLENGIFIRCINRADENTSEPITACAANNICYDANGGEGAQMANTSASASSSVILAAPKYARQNAAFIGWSTSAEGHGTIYGPQEIITAPDTLDTSGLRLYAKWLASSGTMQDFTAAQCTAMDEHDVVALTDSRDGNVYLVAKLKDDRCWMSTNLALDLATANITTLNTNNPTQAFLSDIASISSSNAWCKIADGNECLDETHYVKGSASSSSLYGNYYNWHAATAGNGGYGYPENGQEAAGDICPSGWHLPSGLNNAYAKEYNQFYLAYGGIPTIYTNYDRFPVNWFYSSFFHNVNGSITSEVSTVRYRAWASTTSDETRATMVVADKNVINDTLAVNINNYTKDRGYSVRCIKNAD